MFFWYVEMLWSLLKQYFTQAFMSTVCVWCGWCFAVDFSLIYTRGAPRCCHAQCKCTPERQEQHQHLDTVTFSYFVWPELTPCTSHRSALCIYWYLRSVSQAENKSSFENIFISLIWLWIRDDCFRKGNGRSVKLARAVQWKMQPGSIKGNIWFWTNTQYVSASVCTVLIIFFIHYLFEPFKFLLLHVFQACLCVSPHHCPLFTKSSTPTVFQSQAGSTPLGLLKRKYFASMVPNRTFFNALLSL